MPSRSRAVLALILLLVPAALPGHAAAAPSPHLWATVNRCDTAASPNTIGIRASMPGNGTSQRMYMRFEAQFFDRVRGRFVRKWPVFDPQSNGLVVSGSSSRWVRVGSARFESAQAGFSFEFAPPPAGEQFVFRGRVDYRWNALGGRPGNKRWVTVLKRRRHTRAGFLGVVGGDPPGFSQALCVMK